MPLYYAYENWTDQAWHTPNRVIVHRHDCSHCRNGRGRRGERRAAAGPNDRWHKLGCFDSSGDAMQAARALPLQLSPADTTFRFCGHCRQDPDHSDG